MFLACCYGVTREVIFSALACGCQVVAMWLLEYSE